MHRRLFPFAEVAAFAGILAGGYAIVASTKATAVSGGDWRDRVTIAQQAAAPVPAEPAPPAVAAAPAPVPVPAAAQPSPRAPTRVSADAARAPVPLLLAARPQGSQWSQGSDEARKPDASPDGAAALDQGDARKATADAAAARAMIEADGYKNVRSVVKGPDGTWRGVAMRGTVEVAITVDGDGNVTTQ